MRAALFLVLVGAVAGCGGSGGDSTNTQVFTSLAVSPATGSVAPGATTQLSATPKDQNGHTMSGIGAPTWSSADATIASVDANSGLVTGVAAGGPVAITATATGAGITKTGTASITVAAAGGTASVTATTSQTFDPATVTITHGGTVTWVFQSLTHNVTFDNVTGAPQNIGDTANQSVDRMFPTAGTFTYHCTIHPGMNGTVVVQ